MQQIPRIVSSIERTHRNLGVPTVLMKAVDLADMGGFLVASRGRGKTTVLETIARSLSHRDVLVVNTITPAGARRIAKKLDNNSLTIINKDFSGFYSDYLKDAGINLISSLITDHTIMSTTGVYAVDISNCYISFLSAVQPRMLRQLSKIPGWESMYRDRFLRIFMLYARGPSKPTASRPSVPPVEVTPDLSHVAMPESLRDRQEYRRMLKIFIMQTSDGRGQLWLDSILKALASLDGKEAVTREELKLLDACALYLVPDILLSERSTVGSPLVFNDDAYAIMEYMVEHGEATKQQLREQFMVSYPTLHRDMEPLLRLGIIRGVFGEWRYTLNPRFAERYVKPLLELYEVML